MAKLKSFWDTLGEKEATKLGRDHSAPTGVVARTGSTSFGHSLCVRIREAGRAEGLMTLQGIWTAGCWAQEEVISFECYAFDAGDHGNSKCV